MTSRVANRLFLLGFELCSAIIPCIIMADTDTDTDSDWGTDSGTDTDSDRGTDSDWGIDTDTDGEANIDAYSATRCNDGARRCAGYVVQYCENNVWVDKEACATMHKKCRVVQGVAQCIVDEPIKKTGCDCHLIGRLRIQHSIISIASGAK